MKVVHKLSDFAIENESLRPSFLLTNKIGGYISLAEDPISRYQGLLFMDDFQMYKTIDNIKLLNEGSIKKVINRFWCVERDYGNAKETFFMPQGRNREFSL